MTCKTVRVDVSPPLQVVQVSPPRGYSAYEVAVQQGFVGTVEEWNEAVNAARSEAQLAAIEAVKSERAAMLYEQAAQLSADLAISANRIYQTSSAGQGDAALSEGEYYWVVSSNEVVALELLQKGASSPIATGKQITSYKYAKRNKLLALAGIVL